jgi:hypothetical protein
LLAVDVITLILIVIRKLIFPKLEKYPASDFAQEKCQEVKSLK